ncbi:MAG: site-specific integrase [Bacteroidota bacterium]|nr:site-specific integrase [Bacteroidota bacterium]
MITVKLAPRKDFQKKDGSSPICLFLTIDRKKKRFSLNHSIPLDAWDNKNSLIKLSYPDADQVNLLLKSHKKRAADIIYKYELEHKPLTFDIFEREFKQAKSNCFYSFIELEIKNYKNRAVNVSSTIAGYNTDLSKLQKFRSSLSFRDITVSFLSSYEGYMRNKLKNQQNTIHKSLKFIRTFVNRAIKQGLMQEYPFRNYTLKTVRSKREFLTYEELQKIDLHINEPIPSFHRKYLKIFIFCCHTGLRYQDIRSLRHGNIEGSALRITMHKTKEIVSVPLTKRAIELIGHGGKDEFVFKVPTNQVLNKYLKQIFINVGIEKTLSFHCSRHTFATVGLTFGIPIEVISKLLGHQDIKTTQIYAKVVDQVKIREMAKWDQEIYKEVEKHHKN